MSTVVSTVLQQILDMLAKHAADQRELSARAGREARGLRDHLANVAVTATGEELQTLLNQIGACERAAAQAADDADALDALAARHRREYSELVATGGPLTAPQKILPPPAGVDDQEQVSGVYATVPDLGERGEAAMGRFVEAHDRADDIDLTRPDVRTGDGHGA